MVVFDPEAEDGVRFGSTARGDDRPDSDIDLLVRLDRQLGLIGLARVRHELEDILVLPVDVVPDDGLKPDVRAAVERDVLSRVLTSPAGKIPSALIDASTGLAKNNLQASCRATAPRTFVCTVRPVTHEDREGLTVRYRQTRRGPAEVTWGRYRRR